MNCKQLSRRRRENLATQLYDELAKMTEGTDIRSLATNRWNGKERSIGN